MGRAVIQLRLACVLRAATGLSTGLLLGACATKALPRATAEQASDSAVAVSKASVALGNIPDSPYRVTYFERRDSMYVIELIPHPTDPAVVDLGGGVVMVYFDGRVKIVQRYR